jgi:hypothetical protein
MGGQITIELSAKDAEMVAAWQRQRDNVGLFEEKIKSAQGHSKGWTDEMQEGFKGVGRSLLGNLVSIEAVTKGAEFLTECYRGQVRELHEIVAKQRESREELTHLLTLSGKGKEAPAVEKALDNIGTAKKDEKLAVYKSVSEAAPELATQKQTELTKQIAPLAEILGTGGASEVGKIAGTLSKVAPDKSERELANLAHMARQHSGGHGAELGDDGSLRALQILKQKRVGMSTEQALAFESEGMSKGLGARDMEKIATALDKDEDMEALAKGAKTPEGRAKLHFYREHDRQKRLAMLHHDKGVRQSVLGDREGEKFGLMSEQGVASRAEEYRQGEAGFNDESLKEHERHDAVGHRLRTTEIAIEREKEGYGRKSHEELYELGEKEEELKMRKEGRSETYIKAVQEKERLAVDLGGAPAPGATQALLKEQTERQHHERMIANLEREKTLPGADRADLQQSIDRNKFALLSPEEQDEKVQAARQHRGAAGGDHPQGAVGQQLVEHAAKQTELLQRLVDKPQSVAVNVQAGGGSRGPRINATERAEPSWSEALGANQ